MRLILASNNAHKRKELSDILTQLGMEVVSMQEAGIFLTPEENGETFEENSYAKAKAVFDACHQPVIADDSGLMVDALGGAPGVYSARYGGAQCKSDGDRLNYLLKQLKDVPPERRTAHFVCVITLLLPDGRRLTARGECPGVILDAPQGENGFGYDPVFYVPERKTTFAMLPEEEKNRISHRARALRLFVQKLQMEEYDADK